MLLPTALLTLPAPGDRTFAGLERKVRLLALRALLTHRGGLDAPRAAALTQVQRVLAAVAARHKRATLAAIALPDVLPSLLVLRAGLRPAGPLLDGAVPTLLLALRRAGAWPEAVVWPGPLAGIIDGAGLQVFRFSPPAQALLVAPEGAEVRLHDGALQPLDAPDPPAFHAVRAGLHLSLIDSNPLADVEDHPDKHGNAIHLGGRPAVEWVGALQQALALVDAALPTWMAELPLALRRVIPVGFEPERHLSASYREAPGLCYLTLHPDPLTLAEALVHETQHGKLGVALHLDPVLHNGRTTWTPSPVRPDLRPLMGVLLAVHAFVPVAALHARLVEGDHPLTHTARFSVRQRAVLAGNARGLSVVERLGEPTPLGARLVADLRALHDATAARISDLVLSDSALPPG